MPPEKYLKRLDFKHSPKGCFLAKSLAVSTLNVSAKFLAYRRHLGELSRVLRGSELPPAAAKLPSGRGIFCWFLILNNCCPLPRASPHGGRHLDSSVSLKQETSLGGVACSCQPCLQILGKRTLCKGDSRPKWAPLALLPEAQLPDDARDVPCGLKGLVPESRLVRAGAAGPHQVPRNGLAAGMGSRLLNISWKAKGISEHSPLLPIHQHLTVIWGYILIRSSSPFL